MALYDLYGHVAATKYLGQVEANSVEEAIEKGYNLDEIYVTVCHQCSSDVEDPQVTDIGAFIVQ